MIKAIFDEELEEQKASEPMTVESLRARLKHIACLCWGLSSDLFNDLELSGLFEEENRELRKKLSKYDKQVAKSVRRISNMPAAERREAEINRLKHNKCRRESDKKRRQL